MLVTQNNAYLGVCKDKLTKINEKLTEKYGLIKHNNAVITITHHVEERKTTSDSLRISYSSSYTVCVEIDRKKTIGVKIEESEFGRPNVCY